MCSPGRMPKPDFAAALFEMTRTPACLKSSSERPVTVSSSRLMFAICFSVTSYLVKTPTVTTSYLDLSNSISLAILSIWESLSDPASTPSIS